MDRKLSKYLELERQFPTDCGEYKCFLFIDVKLMLNFLKSLPKKGLLNLRVGFDHKKNEQNSNKKLYNLSTNILEIETLVDNIHSNERSFLIRLNEIENNMKNYLNYRQENEYIKIYVHIYIFEYINTKIRN
jgi:hypothetical protein